MKRIIIYFLVSLFLISCSDGIKDEAVGGFLLPGINYGDDFQELIDKGVVQEKFHSPEGKYYYLNATIYGYEFINDKDALSVVVDNGKIKDVLLSGTVSYDAVMGEEIPPLIKMAMMLENELTSKIGTPTKTQKLHYAYKTMQTTIQWNKNGLKYELNTCPGPQNMFWEINYSVESSKDDV